MEERFGRGRGKSYSNSTKYQQNTQKVYKPSYKQLNVESLKKFYGAHIDEETLWELYKQNEFDMDKTIQNLTTLTGIVPTEDPTELKGITKNTSDLPKKRATDEISGNGADSNKKS